MPLQKIETIDEQAARALVQGNLFDPVKAHCDNFPNEYVANQDRELNDPEIAKQALIQWAKGLYKIWSYR